MNNLNAAPTFLYDIPSIHEKHAGMPAALRNLNLNNSIAAGDALEYHHVEHAKSLATSLRNLHTSLYEPLVTPEMVAAATSRAVAVESTYASVEYSPQNLMQALDQINVRLGIISQQGKIGLAQTFNSRTITRNKYLRGQPLEPLQKVVPGYGRNRALPFLPVLTAAGQQAFHAEFPVNANILPRIGETPPGFQAMLDDYLHIDILRMIVFYNDTFGILAGDTIGARIDKFRRYLTEY